jgi:hypothetical protein
MDELIDLLINEIDLEARGFLQSSSDLENFAHVEEFVNKKRQAFIDALNNSRQNLTEFDETNKSEEPAHTKYFFRYQLNYVPDATNYKLFLGYLYIVEDGYINAEKFSRADLFTRNLFMHEFKCYEKSEEEAEDFIRFVSKGEELLQIERLEIKFELESKSIEIDMYNVASFSENRSRVVTRSAANCQLIINMLNETNMVVIGECIQIIKSQTCDVKLRIACTTKILPTFKFTSTFEDNECIKALDFSSARLAAWASDKEITVAVDDLEDLRIEQSYFQFLVAGNRYEYIRELNLSGNNLTSFDDSPFRDLVNLIALDLSKNKFAKIEKQQFENVRKLEYLDLSFNLLEALEDECFQNLINLEVLDLSNNRLRLFNRNTFVWLEYLETLELSNNPVTEACTYCEIIEALNGLYRVKYLYELNKRCKFDWARFNLQDEERMAHKEKVDNMFCFYIKNEDAQEKPTKLIFQSKTREKFLYWAILSHGADWHRKCLSFRWKRTNPVLGSDKNDQNRLTYLTIIDCHLNEANSKLFDGWNKCLCSIVNKEQGHIDTLNSGKFFIVSTEVCDF